MLRLSLILPLFFSIIIYIGFAFSEGMIIDSYFCVHSLSSWRFRDQVLPRLARSCFWEGLPSGRTDEDFFKIQMVVYNFMVKDLPT
jgi:hypothetical protein